MSPPTRWRPSIRWRLTLWYTGILLATLVVISFASYSLLRWSLLQDVDASLLAVANVMEDTGYAATGSILTDDAENALRTVLGPEFYDKFFQLVDPDGRPGPRSPVLGAETLPLSAKARGNAARGVRTFETVRLAPGGSVRLLTFPIVRQGAVTELIQVGMSLDRARRALDRYLESLLVLGPLGIGLAAVGGAVVAQKALKPVDEMSRTARRITGEDLARRVAVRGTGDELDHLAGTLNAMLTRLEDAFTQMRRYAAEAAHELRTPLTALKGGIEVALRAERSADEYRQVLRSGLEEVERLIRLSEDVLLLSRFSVGAGPARTRVELEPLVVDALDTGVRLGHARGVTVRLDGVRPAAALGDAMALRRAILNLVDNAVKYTPAGGKVELSLAREGGVACVAIRDTGIGVEGAHLDDIFQPFVRLDSAQARDSGGTGLGLPIARSIVTAHGGTLTVQSTPGAGSTFTITLPLA
jgi:heavy metal sensor kinase